MRLATFRFTVGGKQCLPGAVKIRRDLPRHSRGMPRSIILSTMVMHDTNSSPEVILDAYIYIYTSM